MISLKFYKLFLPPIVTKSFWRNTILKFSKRYFSYEQNCYGRYSFILRALFKYSNKKNLNYLEIGVGDAQFFNSIPINNKIGVDPNRKGNRDLTSDNFFKKNKLFFNVIFIDGLHTYEQCSRDLENCIKFLKNNTKENKNKKKQSNGIIFIHDLLPRNHHESKIYKSGDVWKVAVELSQSNNMEFKIVNIDCGVGILKLKKNYSYIRDKNLINLNFEDFYSKYYKLLPIISSEEAFKFIDA